MNSFDPKLRRLRPLLGTFVEIQLGSDDDRHRQVLHQAMERIAEIQRSMSIHDPNSELSRLNAAPLHQFHPVSDDLMTVVLRGLFWSQKSQGDFDMTILPLLQQHGLVPDHHPDPTTIRGYQWLDCEPTRGIRRRANIRLDTGGIAKGFAVDAAVKLLEQQEISDYLINAGGDLRIGRAPVAVLVRHPVHPEHLIPIASLSGCAIASSASYFQCNRMGIHPLFHPESGQCTNPKRAVSVIHACAMDADALTKVIAIRGCKADAWLREQGATAWIKDAESAPSWIGSPCFGGIRK